MKPASDPLASWPITKVMETIEGKASNDVYGKSFYYVRNQFRMFVERLRTLDIHVEVYCRDAKDLPKKLDGVQFDRIDVRLPKD